MTVASLFSDMILIGVFMLAGFFVREIVKPIQKLFLPASLIGGLLALILGQQMLGLVEIPESFSKFSNVLIAPIMAALLFGVTINKKKVVGYMDYICVEQGIYGNADVCRRRSRCSARSDLAGSPEGMGHHGRVRIPGRPRKCRCSRTDI